MTDWTMIYWQGPLEASTAALRGLGWHGPDEAPAALPDARIGGYMPMAGCMPRTFDGTAYVAVVANAPLATPPGLQPAGPELARALLGSF